MSIPNYYRPVYSEKDSQAYNLFEDMKKRYQTMSNRYIPTTVNPTKYDSNKINNVGKDLNVLQEIQDAAENSEAYARDAADQQQANREARDATRSDDDSDGGWLSMIFQVIPIGINVVRKGPVIARGFKEMLTAVIDLVKNLAITTVILFRDTFVFTGHAFFYIYTLILCTVFNLTNLHKCILFYLFDLFMFGLKMIIISLLFMIDVFFYIKGYAGISAVEGFYLAMDFISYIDEIIYQITDIHVLSYPNFIIKLCYRCEMMGDTTNFHKAKSELGYDITILVPENIGAPLSMFTTGVSNVFSFFKL
jgi:hypothetical protein